MKCLSYISNELSNFHSSGLPERHMRMNIYTSIFCKSVGTLLDTKFSKQVVIFLLHWNYD